MPVAPPAPPAGPDEVEAQFYDALRRADLERLMALWADDDDIVCVHPGGGRAVGHGAIRASFESIFAGGTGVPVHAGEPRRLTQPGSALHHLVERITVQTPAGRQTAWALASNWYVRTPQGWRIAVHHASPAQPQAPEPMGGDAASLLH